MRLRVQPDREQVLVAGNGAGPVAVAVRHAAHHAVRPLRGAPPARHDRDGRETQPGQGGPGAGPRGRELAPPLVDGLGDDRLLLGEQGRAGQVAEGLLGDRLGRENGLDHRNTPKASGRGVSGAGRICRGIAG